MVFAGEERCQTPTYSRLPPVLCCQAFRCLLVSRAGMPSLETASRAAEAGPTPDPVLLGSAAGGAVANGSSCLAGGAATEGSAAGGGAARGAYDRGAGDGEAGENRVMTWHPSSSSMSMLLLLLALAAGGGVAPMAGVVSGLAVPSPPPLRPSVSLTYLLSPRPHIFR